MIMHSIDIDAALVPERGGTATLLLVSCLGGDEIVVPEEDHQDALAALKKAGWQNINLTQPAGWRWVCPNHLQSIHTMLGLEEKTP